MNYKCPKCGNMVEEGVSSCSTCGQMFRWPQSATPTQNVESFDSSKIESNLEVWTCNCKNINTGEFCLNCGLPKPKEITSNTDIEDCTTNNINESENSDVVKEELFSQKQITWQCECGSVNTTNFCVNCGKPKDKNENNSPQTIYSDDSENVTKKRLKPGLIIAIIFILATIIVVSSVIASQSGNSTSTTTSTTRKTTTTTKAQLPEVAYNDWTMSHYLDEFGNANGDWYVSLIQSRQLVGTFSNTATTNSILVADVIIDAKSASFVLYEYGTNMVKNTWSSDDNYTIKIQDKDGNQYTLTGYMAASGGNRVTLDNSKYFIEALRKGNVDVYIASNEVYSEYRFTVKPVNLFSLIE